MTSSQSFVLSLLHNESIQEIFVYIYLIQGRKCALSSEHFLAHVALSGDIGKMLAGPRMENLMFAQGEDGDGEDDDEVDLSLSMRRCRDILIVQV